MKETRLERERKVLREMILLYCNGRHRGEETPCPSCQSLLDYGMSRLERCPQGERKPFCSHCAIHCYSPERRKEIKAVMRYAGPRMLLYHPLLTLKHYGGDLFPFFRK